MVDLGLKFLRVIDANFNRAKEGLRVCEDICRFWLDEPVATKILKELRHRLTKIMIPLGLKDIIAGRDVGKDIGRQSTPSESRRKKAEDIFYANSQRVKESLRVLEEFAKLRNIQTAQRIKALRYEMYVVEKKSFGIVVTAKMTGLLQRAKLYVVLDSSVADFDQLFVILKKTVKAGTTIVQLRSKEGSARDILAFSKKALLLTKGRALFILNDRVDLACVCSSDGVHLGQDDLSVQDARKILGSRQIIGVSCQTLAQAKKAEKDGADYIGFGSVFKTQTKPERTGLDLKIISRVSQEIKIPVFFIGGITLDNVGQVFEKGGRRFAVTRAICEASDVGAATKKFLKGLRHCGA